MTDDLISRADAIKELKEDMAVLDRIVKGLGGDDVRLDHYVAQHNQISYDIYAIEHIPSAQPKRGEWVNHEEPCVNGGYWHYVMCTACKEKAITPTNFCPNCGARMTERSE